MIQSWLDKSLKITMTDSRILVGDFLCTDRTGNIILGLTYEYVDEESEGRYLGSVMVPGKHIVKMEVDMTPATGTRGQHKALQQQQQQQFQQQQLLEQEQRLEQLHLGEEQQGQKEEEKPKEETVPEEFNTVGV